MFVQPWGARGRRFKSCRPDHNKINYLAENFENKWPFGTVFATNLLSAVTRKNPPLSELVRLGLWRVCGTEHHNIVTMQIVDMLL